MQKQTAEVGVLMGSQSDWSTMRHCVEMLTDLGISCEKRIVSAHRTPELLADYAKKAESSGIKIIIAGAGGAAHLPGMLAAHTHLPILGVPVKSSVLSGVDSLLSIVQMPKGIPVGTLAIGKAGAANAALLAASILALHNLELKGTLLSFRKKQTEGILADSIPKDELPK